MISENSENGDLTVKTKEELLALKAEVEAVCKKLRELTEEELAQVSGGVFTDLSNYIIDDNRKRRISDISSK